MGLKYILERFAQKTGVPCIDYNGVTAETEQRDYALGFINEGAQELYDAADHVGTMEELIMSMNPDTQLALPSYVGKLRAMREFNTYIPWKLSTLRPRYHINSWPQQNYRNLREKGTIPIGRSVSNSAPPTVIVTEIETPPVEITIIGSTLTAGRISETVIMDALSKTFTKSFIEYETVSKNRINNVDVLIEDVDGVELAIIYNHELTSSYKLIDLSEYNITNVGTDLTFEILYKKKLKLFRNNSDEFPVPDFDNVIINKAVQLFAEDKGDIALATLYDGKAQRTSERKSLDELKGKEMVIEFSPHKHQGLRGRRFFGR